MLNAPVKSHYLTVVATFICLLFSISGAGQNYEGVWSGAVTEINKDYAKNRKIERQITVYIKSIGSNKVGVVVINDGKEYFAHGYVNNGRLSIYYYTFYEEPVARLTDVAVKGDKLEGEGLISTSKETSTSSTVKLSRSAAAIPSEFEQKINSVIAEQKQVQFKFADIQPHTIRYEGVMPILIEANADMTHRYSIKGEVELLNAEYYPDVYFTNEHGEKLTKLVLRSIGNSNKAYREIINVAALRANLKLKSGSIAVRVTIQNAITDQVMFQKDLDVTAIPFPQPKDFSNLAKNFRTNTIFDIINAADLTKRKASLYILDSLITSGDAIAKAWKGYFIRSDMPGLNINKNVSKYLYNESISAVENAAGKGSTEAFFLLASILKTREIIEDVNFSIKLPQISFYDGSESIQYYKLVSNELTLAKSLQEMVMTTGYPIAMLEQGSVMADAYQQADSITKGRAMLIKAYEAGYTKAAVKIGFTYLDKAAADKNTDKAREWFNKAAVKNDASSMTGIGVSYWMDGDENNAIIYLTKAADKEDADALTVLSDIFLNKRTENEENVVKAMAYARRAAELGDPKAMATFGACLYTGFYGEKYKDVMAGVAFIKKAAEFGDGYSMKLLGAVYLNGNGYEQNIIRSRYWLNQAAMSGYGQGNKDMSEPNVIMKSLEYLDFSPRRYVQVRNGYGQVVESYYEGPGVLDLAFDAVGGAMKYYLSQTQEHINGIEFIQTVGGADVYGGTATSMLQTKIFVKKGQRIVTRGWGNITFGVFAGTGNIMGVYGPSKFSITQNLKHGCLMVKVGDGEWDYAGGEHVVKQDGYLTIAVNDRDFIGNKGYFDYELQVLPPARNTATGK